MKILFIAPPPDGKGPVSKHTPILVEHLILLGCDVDLVYRDRNEYDTPLLRRIITRVLDIPRITEYEKKSAEDIIVLRTAHDYKTLLRDIPLCWFLRMNGGKIVIQFHGSDLERLKTSYIFRLLSGWLLNLSIGILVLSKEELRIWKKFWPNIQFFVVNNPIPSLPPSNKNKTELHDQNQILFVGRMIRSKGIFEVVEAVDKVRKKCDCKLKMVGDGPELEELRERIREYDMSAWVSTPGWVEGNQLWEYYQTSSIFVLPSWREGQPTVLFEASHFGLPVITTKVGATADYFIEGKNAIFVPKKDVSILASKIIQLLEDYQLRAYMKLANQKLVSEFSPDKVAENYLLALDKIFSNYQVGLKE